jgi:CubicO group peptidase (beta-lactamase class C family)
VEIAASTRAILARCVEQGVAPGYSLAIVKTTGELELAVGGLSSIGGQPVCQDTRYDVASLTKVVATLPSILRLVAAQEIELSDPIERYFSSAGWFQEPSLADSTVRQLLTHTSGLPAWTPLYSIVSRRETALAAVLNSEIRTRGEIVYSDLGFMLLGALVERVTRERLDDFAWREVFEPLGMLRSSYGPLDSVSVAATEDCGWRNRVLYGEVHDENAVVWEGVAGHAGVFSTASDLARFAKAWLDRDPRLGPEWLLEEATRMQCEDAQQRRGLGWMISGPGWFAGDSTPGFGHTGFTGTSICIDQSSGCAVVLLTNRVHPRRGSPDGIGRLRSALHRNLWARDGDGSL